MMLVSTMANECYHIRHDADQPASDKASLDTLKAMKKHCDAIAADSNVPCATKKECLDSIDRAIRAVERGD
jgi:hypothetical protein